ncbi:MAG: NAD-dependent epimerase/dehydratase family protein [Candidatus Omnitrophica bacterium]|nr:NAD-dependent epimerase/dehydratase family protein [bacterium]MBV6482955.1 GDP-L-fucose synthase [bacterium]MBW7939444.1 NAD-dependent epimerase/dehydratase family protein [Candidatus Omnitrophota bacterium]
MKAFITGATGFLGSNLAAALLKENIGVRALRRQRSSILALKDLDVELIEGDILASPDQLASWMKGCGWVFHTAARIQYDRSPKEIYQANVEGTRHTAQAALRAGVERFVYTSSLSAMGVSDGRGLLTEESCFNLTPTQFPYGHSKLLAEQELGSLIEEGLPAVIVNPATLFGPRDINQNAGAMVLQAARGLMRLYPPGGSNFIAVDDVVQGHIAAARQGAIGRRYILGHENLTYREIFSRVCQVVGKGQPRIPMPAFFLKGVAGVVGLARPLLGGRLPVDANQVRMSTRCIYADSTRAIRELGLPQSSLDEAIRASHEWYIENNISVQSKG